MPITIQTYVEWNLKTQESLKSSLANNRKLQKSKSIMKYTYTYKGHTK